MTTPDESLHEMLRGFINRFETFMDEQREVNDRVSTSLDAQQGFNNRVDMFMDEQREVNADARERLRTMGNDLGVVKGGYARTEILRKASVIAHDMGYNYIKNLRRAQILAIASQATTSIDEAVLSSFRNADLIMEVEDANHQRNYIAVEASYTVQERDVERAKRNAGLLHSFTEIKSHAAVAGVEMNGSTLRQARDLQVHWYRIPHRDLQPE